MAESDLQADLHDAAEEELERACTLGWRQLAVHTPWGDTYEGYTPGGRDVCFERNYLWRDEAGGDICAEVVVYEPQAYESGVRLMRILPRKSDQETE
jgi:hypothetical protein